MDTITHGIAGALIGKALFHGDDLFALRAMNRQRLVTWSLMVGAIFPDSDVFRELFSKDDLLILTWHRSITHSLVCLPIWALALAALTGWLVRWRKWEAPSFAALTGIYALGILSHILLDLVTSFGTMVWSPLKWSRPAWDLIFILDLTLTAIFLLPQWIAWTYSNPERRRRRALWLSVLFLPAPLLFFAVLQNVGAPISATTVLALTLLLAALILLPSVRGWGFRVPAAAWNRAGLAVACAYIGVAVFAHHSALERVKRFAAFEHLDVDALGALPLPPSLWHWDGLIRAPRGVFEFRIDLSERSAVTGAETGPANAIEYHYFPDARSNSYIEAARRLPEVEKVLWFARFPVTRFHKEGDDAVVEFFDMRFPQVRRDRPASFTYQVKFGPAGNILSQGWLRP